MCPKENKITQYNIYVSGKIAAISMAGCKQGD